MTLAFFGLFIMALSAVIKDQACFERWWLRGRAVFIAGLALAVVGALR